MTTKNMGLEAFCWFVGIVENRDDDKMLGRVQVRVYNFYSANEAVLPTSRLPWAYPLQSINSAASAKVGLSPTGITVGSTVVGFFMDGKEAQLPIILGTLGGIPGNDMSKHDVANRARGINGLTKSLLEKEPADPYAAKYPFNKVFQSESGHIIEVDDTPGNERIHIYHKSGTYHEINRSGDVVTRVAGSSYEIVAKDKEVFIKGNVDVHVTGNVRILVDGTYTLESKGNMTFKAPRIDLNP